MDSLSKEYSCNSVFIYQKKAYSLIEKDIFSCKAKFLTSHTNYWIETRLEFEGEYASKFYQTFMVDLKLQVLIIGHRKTSPNFFRIYKKSNGKFIRLELEMKLKTAKKFQFFLFVGQFETLESKLIQHYYSYIMTKFDIQRSYYTDWIVENF